MEALTQPPEAVTPTARERRGTAGGHAAGFVPSARHFVRSVAALGVAQVVTWVAGGALTVVGPRYLGDVDLGKVVFAQALLSLVGLVATLGTGTYLSKEIARDPARAPALVTNTFVVRLGLSVVALAIPLGMIALVPTDQLTRTTVAVMSLLLVMSAPDVSYSALQGTHRMTSFALGTTVTRLVSVAGAIAALVAGYGAVGYAVAWVLGDMAGKVVAGLALLRVVRPASRVEVALLRAVFLGGLPFVVWQAALVIYGQVDVVLLQFLSSQAVVGWYAAAYRIILIPSFLPSLLVTVTFPALAATALRPGEFNTIARRALRVLMLLSVPTALGIMLLPDRLIGVLGYPPSFQHSVLPIMLLAPHIPLVAADMVIGASLNACDRQRQWALAGIVAAVFNIVLNLVAIPYSQARWGNGAIGAATVTTLTEVLIMVVGLRLLPRGMFDRATVADTLRILAAGLAMCVLVWPLRHLPIAVPIAVGALTYGVVCLAIRAITLTEVRDVVAHLRDRAASRLVARDAS